MTAGIPQVAEASQNQGWPTGHLQAATADWPWLQALLPGPAISGLLEDPDWKNEGLREDLRADGRQERNPRFRCGGTHL